METKCNLCGAESKFLLSKDGFNLYKCLKCELVFVQPQPEASFLAKEVYSAESGYQANKESNLAKSVLSSKKERVLRYVTSNINKGKILDVGCSNGDLLWHFKNKGFDVYGVEVNKRTALIAKSNGLNIFNGFLADANFGEKTFDCIYLGDIIEHVNNPRNLLIECSRILKDGGMLIVSTPNLDCLWSKLTWNLYRLFGIPWSSVTPPHHLFQFSVGNLDKLVLDIGFDKKEMWFERPPRLVYELGTTHLLKSYKKSKRIKDLIFMLFAFSLYTISYFLNYILGLFLRKNFAMIGVYTKK